jgi:hypothetical protein
MISVLPVSHTLYIDVSLHSVSVALVEKGALSSLHTVRATRSTHFPDSRHFHKTLVAIRVRAQELIEILCREYNVKQYSVVFTVHAPLCSSRSIQHTYAFKGDTTITKLHIQEVLESARKATAETNSAGTSSVFREYMTGVALNGYHTDTPIGKIAHEATCTIIQESLAGGVQKAVIEPLSRGGTSYEIHNYAQLVGIMLGGLHTEAGATFALCEIAPESFEISVYTKRTMTHQVTLPIGGRRLLEGVRAHLGITHEFVEGLLRLHADGTLTDDVSSSLTAFIEQSAQELKAVLQQQSSGVVMFPARMFLITERHHEHFWVSVLSKALDNPSLVPEKIVFDAKHIAYMAVHAEHMLLAIYAHVTTDPKATALPV